MDRFSVLIPCYNEPLEEVKRSLAFMDGYFRKRADFTVVENGSRLLEPLAGRYPNVEYLWTATRGLGGALKLGLRCDRHEKAVFLPADLSFGLDFVDRALKEKAEIVIGSKGVRGSKVERPLHRKAVSLAYNAYHNLRHGLRIKDITGTKLYDVRSVQPLFSQCPSDGIAFEVELLKEARKRGLRIHEIPVSVRDFRRSRYSPV